MKFLIRRLKSIFFWGLCLWLFQWQLAQSGAIAEKVDAAQLETDRAKQELAAGMYDPITICRDGWQSSSTGQGTCSWHRGIDYGYYQRRSEAEWMARRDIRKLEENYKSSARSTAIVWFALAFFFAPLIDFFVLGRSSLYEYSEEPNSNRPRIDPALGAPQSSPPPRVSLTAPQNGLPPCPLCGSEMRTRKARRGRTRGQYFLGCSAYPGCHGTRPMPNAEGNRPGNEKDPPT